MNKTKTTPSLPLSWEEYNGNDTFCYIHIPFCTSKCKYCRFASFGNINDIKVNLYVQNLINEIKTSKIDSKKLESIYFGGGTPGILSVKQLESIILALKEKYGFNDNIEINIEATPVTVTEKNIEGWKTIGINRISCGLQTLNNKSLTEIGRGEKGDIIDALNNFESVGFPNVSVDFIIGLPHVKKGEIKNNIEFILNKYSFIKHISVYMLEEYYDVPEYIDSKFENITYPDNWEKLGIQEEDYLNEYIEIKEFLIKKGFNRYEISNFGKEGYNCKHNKAYWNHSEMLAFGLGAHGFINNTRFCNSENFIEYYTGKNIIIEKLNNNDLFLEKVMFQLRTSGIDSDIYEKLDIKKIDEFIELGYIKKKSNKIVLLDKGVVLMDYILGEII